MRIWLVTTGEPLPTDGPDERLLRTGILAGLMANSGHQVTWWTSAFDHARKRHRCTSNEPMQVKENYDIRLLPSLGYSGNVSLRRVLDHRGVAKQFSRLASQESLPDLILCSWPTIELCYQATRFGAQHGVPVVLDIRDMWPEAIVDIIPSPLRPAARLALRRSYRLGRQAASQATTVIGITEQITDWGVKFAGRPRSDLDRAFPMGYRVSSFSDESLTDAARSWRDLGQGLDGSQFVACFFGTIGRHFEFETIKEAAAKLNETGRDITFVLCGDGPHLPQWKRSAANCPNVIFPGWVDAARIHALMQISSVGLAPYYSSWDFQMSIPNKPIEYMSAGLPVISSLQGVLADLLRENECGLTYQNGDSDDLVRLLSDCYDHASYRHRLTENSRRIFRQRFTAETVYTEMQNYLVGVADRSRRKKAA
jgi:glycosyltransferase involved in cell wall biosynthesis